MKYELMDRNKLAEEYAVANEQATLNVERIKRAFLAGFDACLSQLSGLENESRSAIACRLILANAKIQELEKENSLLNTGLVFANTQCKELEQQLKAAEKFELAEENEKLKVQLAKKDVEIMRIKNRLLDFEGRTFSEPFILDQEKGEL